MFRPKGPSESFTLLFGNPMNRLIRRRRPRRLCVETLESRTVLSGAAYRGHFVDLVAAGAEFEYDELSRLPEAPPAAIRRPALADGGEFRVDRPSPPNAARGNGPEFGLLRNRIEPPTLSFVLVLIPISYGAPATSLTTTGSTSTGMRTSGTSSVDPSASQIGGSNLSPGVDSLAASSALRSPTSSVVTTSTSSVSLDGALRPATSTPLVLDSLSERPSTAVTESAATGLSAGSSTTGSYGLHDLHDLALDSLHRVDAWSALEGLLSGLGGGTNASSVASTPQSGAANLGDNASEVRGNWLALSMSAKSNDFAGTNSGTGDAAANRTAASEADVRWSAEAQAQRDGARLARLETRLAGPEKHTAPQNSAVADSGTREFVMRAWSSSNGDWTGRTAATPEIDAGRWIELPVVETTLRQAPALAMAHHPDAARADLTSHSTGSENGEGVEVRSDADEPSSPAEDEAAPNTPATASWAISTMLIALVSAWPHRRRWLAPLVAQLGRVWPFGRRTSVPQ